LLTGVAEAGTHIQSRIQLCSPIFIDVTDNTNYTTIYVTRGENSLPLANRINTMSFVGYAASALIYTGCAFLAAAFLRSFFVLTAGKDRELSGQVWRNQWLEVSYLIVTGVFLLLLALAISQWLSLG